MANEFEIEYDKQKDEANKEKHQISLNDARLVDWETASTTIDDREDYEEDRYITFGYINTRLYVVV